MVFNVLISLTHDPAGEGNRKSHPPKKASSRVRSWSVRLIRAHWSPWSHMSLHKHYFHIWTLLAQVLWHAVEISVILLYTDDVLNISSQVRDLQTNWRVRTLRLIKHGVDGTFTMKLLSDWGVAWRAFLENIYVFHCMVIVTRCGVSRWLVSWPWLRLTWSARRSAPKPVKRRFPFNCIVHRLHSIMTADLVEKEQHCIRSIARQSITLSLQPPFNIEWCDGGLEAPFLPFCMVLYLHS